MTHVFRLLSAVLIMGGMLAAPAFAQELKVGDPAPDFSLPGSDGKTYTLAQLKGRWVVLAWFPKAFTGG
jgi:thioredoxin-dependent peroxiredoxin